jgi:hypothetical protein
LQFNGNRFFRNYGQTRKKAVLSNAFRSMVTSYLPNIQVAYFYNIYFLSGQEQNLRLLEAGLILLYNSFYFLTPKLKINFNVKVQYVFCSLLNGYFRSVSRKQLISTAFSFYLYFEYGVRGFLISEHAINRSYHTGIGQNIYQGQC